MDRIKNNWSFKKHMLFSLFFSFLIQIIKYIPVTTNNAASIGIIGGADGPTMIFLGSKTMMPLLWIFSQFIMVPIFIILLALYKPTKYLVEKYF